MYSKVSKYVAGCRSVRAKTKTSICCPWHGASSLLCIREDSFNSRLKKKDSLMPYHHAVLPYCHLPKLLYFNSYVYVYVYNKLSIRLFLFILLFSSKSLLISSLSILFSPLCWFHWKQTAASCRAFGLTIHIIRAEQLSFNGRLWGYVMWEFCVWLLHVVERSGHLLKRNALLYLVADGWRMVPSFRVPAQTAGQLSSSTTFFSLTMCTYVCYFCCCCFFSGMPRQASISHDMLFYCMTCCCVCFVHGCTIPNCKYGYVI